MAGPSKELLDAVYELAAENDWSPQDILTIYSYETGGTMDPWKKGPTTKWGEHRGLIQWGEPQRRKYGVTEGMPIREQVQATGRYWKDRGAQPGMGILPLYAAVNGGNTEAINASDEAAGGAPGTVLDKVNNQMEGHRKNAASWTGVEYVPTEDAGVLEPTVPPMEQESEEVPELPWNEQMVEDLKEVGGDIVSGTVKEGAKMLLFGSGDDGPSFMQTPSHPVPQMSRRSVAKPSGPIKLRERTYESKRKGKLY